MVTEDEIKHVAKLMKIEIDDHNAHIDKVKKMIEYFEVLDNAETDEYELILQEQKFENLREDKHIPHKEKLIDKLKNYKGIYFRAPNLN